jgi:DNA modification methylase
MSYGDNNHVNKTESVRKLNILASPKQGGCSNADSDKYLKELGIAIIDDHQPIQFTQNQKQLIHRWAPYVQGFSADFVQNILDKYKSTYKNPYILDPFAGCGTVPVQAKLNGIHSFGVEINPLMQYITSVKLDSWNTDPEELLLKYRQMDFNKTADYPSFLKTEKQFEPHILEGLCHIKGAIEHLHKKTKDKCIIDLFKVAFCSILIDSSNLKRSPCLGYAMKTLDKNTPYILFDQKVNQIAEDLAVVQKLYKKNIKTKASVNLANSMEFDYTDAYDLVITSPPYMNGMDYIINYKIEMAWLGFADNQKTLKKLKNEMVVCDNVSRNLISEYRFEYSNSWIDDIKASISKRIDERGSYRRTDMPNIVHKYFDDMYRVFKKVVPAMKKNARFILVIGDSLIADTYIPTDLFTAKLGIDLGLRIESIAKARDRRSGQIRSYKLRETILTLIKE